MDPEQITVNIQLLKEDGSRIQGTPLQEANTCTIRKLFDRAGIEFNFESNQLQATMDLIIPDEKHLGNYDLSIDYLNHYIISPNTSFFCFKYLYVLNFFL